MNLTCHSEFGRIHSLFIKGAAEAFISDEQMETAWQSLNYLAKPVFSRALDEYDFFESTLKEQSEILFHLPFHHDTGMDSIYCRDASIATNRGMIICHMGKAARRGEPAAEEEAFLAQGIPILGRIDPPGTVEGGDVAWLDENTLAVGHTYRTNAAGIAQLGSLLEPLGVHLVTVALPHYRGPSDVFHLMSILSPVNKNLAVVYSPLMPISFRNLLLDRNYELVEVPETEFETMGCNVLALAPRLCMMVAGNPVTKSRLEKAGCQVITYQGNEISVKGGGGPTCLTRPIWRYK
ncbi:MAG TPA: arginine deiminase family protein [Puia sp.]|nr:arginine deiminase family protein [Puia sp.]